MGVHRGIGWGVHGGIGWCTWGALDGCTWGALNWCVCMEGNGWVCIKGHVMGVHGGTLDGYYMHQGHWMNVHGGHWMNVHRALDGCTCGAWRALIGSVCMLSLHSSPTSWTMVPVQLQQATLLEYHMQEWRSHALSLYAGCCLMGLSLFIPNLTALVGSIYKNIPGPVAGGYRFHLACIQSAIPPKPKWLRSIFTNTSA